MVEIVPAILEPNLASFESKLKKVYGLVKRVQVDVVDGIYASNKTVFPEELENIDTIIEWDWHLMVDKPERWIERCIRGGGGNVFGQIERMEQIPLFISEAQVAGMGVGLGLALETEVEAIKDFVWDIDAVLLLAVDPGKQGGEFDSRVLKKIEEVRELRNDLDIVIDGGLGVDEIKQCLAYEWAEDLKEGQDHDGFLGMQFAVGSKLFEDDNIEQRLEKLRHLKND